MRILNRPLLVLLIGIFLFGCSGKKSGVEGKVVDGQGQSIIGVKITIKQVQPVQGYELFETVTGADGIFRLDGLMPESAYVITPTSNKWKTKIIVKIKSGASGQTLVLNSPVVIRFQAMKDGSIIDTKTRLQWLIYSSTGLSSGSVLSTVKNIREGDFNDWRLPTRAELSFLANSSGLPMEAGAAREVCCAWTSESNSGNIDRDFYIENGNELWASSKLPANDRIVVVRATGGVPAIVQAPTGPAAISSPTSTTPAAKKKEDSKASAPSATSSVTAERKQTTAKELSTTKDVPRAQAQKIEIAKANQVKQSPPPKTSPTAKNDIPQIEDVVIHFAMNKSEIAPEDLAKIKSFYAKVKHAPGKIVITGYADSLGNVTEKIKISVERALKVLDMLKKMGLGDKTKVEVKGMGDAKAAAENVTEEGRKINRRVELSFIPEKN